MSSFLATKSERAAAQKELLHIMSEELEETGFEVKVSSQSFYKNTSLGKWALHVSFIEHKNDFDFTLDVAIRINSIEELVNGFDNKRSRPEKLASMTMGAELGNMLGGQPRRFTVASAASVNETGHKAVLFFKAVGIPFFHSYENVVQVHKALISEKRENMILCPLLGPRYMRAIASASVLDFADEVQSLAPIYLRKLSEVQDLYSEEFSALSRALTEDAILPENLVE